MALSTQQLDRYRALNKLLPEIQKLVSDGIMGMSSVQRIATFNEVKQNEILVLLTAALKDNTRLSRVKIEKMLDEYENIAPKEDSKAVEVEAIKTSDFSPAGSIEVELQEHVGGGEKNPHGEDLLDKSGDSQLGEDDSLEASPILGVGSKGSREKKVKTPTPKDVLAIVDALRHGVGELQPPQKVQKALDVIDEFIKGKL